MARLTLPRLHKETGGLVKLSGKLTETRTYLRSLCSNPRGGDAALVASFREAEKELEAAKASIDKAVSHMASVAKTLERRKAPTTK